MRRVNKVLRAPLWQWSITPLYLASSAYYFQRGNWALGVAWLAILAFLQWAWRRA